MLSAANLGDTVRVSIACFRAVERAATNVYVSLEEVPVRVRDDEARREPVPPPRRFLLRRLYVGSHKSVEGHHTILVCYDLDTPDLRLLTTPYRGRELEVRVRGVPPEGRDIPFEGVFDVKLLEVPRVG